MAEVTSGVEVISRDRWAAYANAYSAGAPQATQVADRFHLGGNIRERVERVFEHHATALDTALEPPPAGPAGTCVATASVPAISSAPASAAPAAAATDGPNDAPARATDAPPVRSHRQQRRQDRFDEVCRLRREGQSIRRIARALRISSKTVLRYARSAQCPDWNPGVPRGTRLDRFAPAVDAFIREGGRTATVLHRRLQGQGCQSSDRAVLRFLGRRLHAAGSHRRGRVAGRRARAALRPVRCRSSSCAARRIAPTRRERGWRP